MQGKCRIKSALGYYRLCMINLVNSELYVYNDENDKDHKKMYILTSVFVQNLNEVSEI